MGINRYVDVNFDQPVSNYVPLPLEMLYKLGKDASKDYEDTMKDMESGKDPISKLNTRSVARIYDPSKGGMIDAPIDFEDQKRGVLDYMNTQKQQIVDDYIKDKDTNKYKQRAARLKGELNSAYSDLAGKSAIVDQINKENIELGKSEAYGLNPAYATKRLQYNTQYLKDLQAGNVQAYAPPSVAKQVSMEDVYAKDITGWKEDDAGSKSYTDGQYIHDVNTKGITGTRVYDYAKRVWNDPNHSARAVANLELEHELNMRGLRPDSLVEYNDYKKDANGDVIKDKQGNPVLEVKQGKFADIFMEDKKRDYAQALADRIVHQTVDTKMSTDAYGLRALDKKDELDSYKNLPIYETNIDKVPTNNKQALQAVGINSPNINDDGSVKTNDIQNISETDKKYHVDRAKEFMEKYKRGEISEQSMLVYGKSYLNTLNKINNNDLKNRYAEKFNGLVKSGFEYGLLTDEKGKANYRMPDGKFNFLKLEADLVELGKNINTSSSNVMGLQANFIPDLNRTYLGETKADADGNTIFEKSSMLQKVAIYEQGDPNSASKIRQEGVDKLAQNGSFVGFDFNDPNLGAATITATKGKGDIEPKLYTAILPDVNLKNSMAPVHKFTQDVNKTLNNKLSPEEKKENYSKALEKISDLAAQVGNSNISDNDKKDIITQLNNSFNSISSNSRGTVYGTTFDGKYTLIGSSSIKDGIPVKNVLRIDNTSGQFEEVSLGDVQYEESAAIQLRHAPGYSKKAPGYEPKYQTYTDR